MTDAVALAVTAVCNLILRLIEDQPPEERRKAWKRWYKFFEPFWKAVGLDVTEDPMNPKP